MRITNTTNAFILLTFRSLKHLNLGRLIFNSITVYYRSLSNYIYYFVCIQLVHTRTRPNILTDHFTLSLLFFCYLRMIHSPWNARIAIGSPICKRHCLLIANGANIVLMFIHSLVHNVYLKPTASTSFASIHVTNNFEQSRWTLMYVDCVGSPFWFNWLPLICYLHACGFHNIWP